MTATTLDRDTRVEQKLDDGDHDRMAHYFKKSDADKAWLDGLPIVALCGKKDIPNRDPKKYPVCPTCKEIYDGIPDERP